MMQDGTGAQSPAEYEMGPPLAWVLVDMAATGSTGVLRIVRPRGPAQIHIHDGKVTRVQADDLEPLVALLVRKQLLSALEMRSALCEVEHLDLTLAEAFEKLGLMNRQSLDNLRARRTKEHLEEIVASGARPTDFEAREPDGGPPIDPVEPVFRGLVRSSILDEWLTHNGDVKGALRKTPTFDTLRAEIVRSVGEALVPKNGDTFEALASRIDESDLRKVAAMVITGALDLEERAEETAEGLEERAAAMEATDEACRLLIRASELYADRGDAAEARRAALSALRRRPTAVAPLAQVERLCIASDEVATLELVYELVNGAMPGPHGRRAVLYRAGRIFETEFADIERAREYYRRAVEQVSESGAALDALRRTSLALGDTLTVADAYFSVSMAHPNPTQREAWLKKALDVARRAGDERRRTAFQRKLEELTGGDDEDATFDDVAEELEAADAAPETDDDDQAVAAGDDDSLDWSDLGDDQAESAVAGQDAPEEPAELDGEGIVEPSSHDSAFWGRMLLQPIDEGSAELRPSGLSGQEGEGEELLLTPSRPPEPAATETKADEGGEKSIDELCGALAFHPADLDTIARLRQALDDADDGPAAQAARSFLALFDEDASSRPLGSAGHLGKITDEVIDEIGTPPDSPEVLALEALWRAASQLVTKDLADLGVGRAIPQRPGELSPAAQAFAAALPLLPTEQVRLLHMASGPVARVAMSRPLSLLTGPGGLVDSPDVRFRITSAVAMCLPRLVLPALLAAQDLTIVLQAMYAAFGRSPPRGSLHFMAASLAQDLWSAVPRSAQAALQSLLADAPLPDVEAMRRDARATAYRLALLITGDAAAAIRTAVSDDPFLAGTDPTTLDGYRRAATKSDLVADLVRLAFWPRYWELRGLS